MKSKSVVAFSLAFTAALAQCFAQGVDNLAVPFDQVVGRALFQENTLLKILRGEHPVVETYIQDMGPDGDFGEAPKADHYFLGKLDLSHGVTTGSFIPKSGSKSGSTTHAFEAFSHLFSVQYVPRGFAQMLLIDGAQFDRDHYDFEFVKREFLGDVRAYVINVAPKKTAGQQYPADVGPARARAAARNDAHRSDRSLAARGANQSGSMERPPEADQDASDASVVSPRKDAFRTDPDLPESEVSKRSGGAAHP
jgi:hypothetical protein